MTNEPTDSMPPDAIGATAGAPDDDVDALRAELEEARGKYMRAAADYQNLRRRSEEERKEYARYTLAALVINYLPVLDDLDRALESVHEEIAEHQWVEGVRMVERKFRAVLEASGVREIGADGSAFDPAVHEAISYAPGPAGQVVAVVQPGYTLDGKVVRPAQVVVGSGAGGTGGFSDGSNQNEATTESAE
ncbi:MAG: nucleotide exchange factor GrpE [Dehalococcoidia bacterium]